MSKKSKDRLRDPALYTYNAGSRNLSITFFDISVQFDYLPSDRSELEVKSQFWCRNQSKKAWICRRNKH